MNKKYLIGIIVVLAVVIVLIASKSVLKKEEVSDNQNLTTDHRNASYIVEGQLITLSDGFSETELALGSAEKTRTFYFGNEIKHDLNGDGREDNIFLLTQERGGSGKFFYVVAALNAPAGYTGSHAFFIGDRIDPQSISIDEGTTTQGTTRENVVVVNFMTRKSDEPFTAAPTVSKSIWIKLDPETMQFGEVAQNFEGESR